MLHGLRQRVAQRIRQLPEGERHAYVARITRLSRLALKILTPLPVSMETLARIAGTDKIGSHDYIAAYARFFREFRRRPITLLEIGVGGYDRTDGGHSLHLWQAYFRRGTIVAIDLYDKTQLSGGRIHVHQCSQVDRDGLTRLARQYGGFDLIIDDGSHLNEHQIETFKILFPLMKPAGVYVIEDTQTSYWPAFGGGAAGSAQYAASATCFFKSLVDGLNHAEFLPPARIAPGWLELSIRGLYFEHNLIAVLKGDNSAGSNIDIHARAQELQQSSAPVAGLLE